MIKRIFLVLAAVFVLMAAVSGDDARAAGDPAVCLKTCIETYGSDKKQACALQCGYGQNQGAAKGRDCGTLYKQCLQACQDNACKNTCRKQRTQCF